MESILKAIPPLHREGYPFVAIFAGVSFILALIAAPLGWIGFILTVWCFCFFRDPQRVTPTREGLVISPADGLVQRIASVVPPPQLNMGSAPRTRISIFMNVFDCHVNRAPVDGAVSALYYHEGKFLNASLDKASEDNERQLMKLTMADGKEVGVVQIAGLVARRIVTYVHDGQPLKAGERFGMIRFGSRVDVYLPEGTVPLAIEGQRAVAGETVLAELQTSETQRLGEVR